MADVASAYLEGLRIAQSRSQQQQDAALRSAEMEQSAARAGQEAAYRQQELRMRQQQLEQASQQTARKYAAQKAYQQFIAGGGDPLQGILKFGPSMGEGSSVSAAARASALAHPKPTVPPTIQMQQGPDGSQIPVLVQGGRASIVPRSAYTKPAAPEQWTETTRQINGNDVPGQISSRSGKFVPYPNAEQPGAVTPKVRLQVAAITRKKSNLLKVMGDDAQKLALAKKRAGGKTPTHADLEAVEADLQKQSDELDQQIDQLTGGKLSAEPAAAGDESAPTETKASSKTVKFVRDAEGNLVLQPDNADQSGN